MQSSPSHYFLVRSRVGVVVCLKDEIAITLFRQLGRVMRQFERNLPDVSSDPQIALLPSYGQAGRDWESQGLLSALPRLHVFEREEEHHPVYQQLKDRPGIVPAAISTTKAGFFNYLSGRAIKETLGVDVEVTDRSDVPRLTAQALHATQGRSWEDLDEEEKADRWLSARKLLAEVAAPAMTPEMLLERKGKADVRRWLYLIKLILPRQFYD